jgi:hypothetical protein
MQHSRATEARKYPVLGAPIRLIVCLRLDGRPGSPDGLGETAVNTKNYSNRGYVRSKLKCPLFVASEVSGSG